MSGSGCGAACSGGLRSSGSARKRAYLSVEFRFGVIGSRSRPCMRLPRARSAFPGACFRKMAIRSLSCFRRFGPGLPASNGLCGMSRPGVANGSGPQSAARPHGGPSSAGAAARRRRKRTGRIFPRPCGPRGAGPGPSHRLLRRMCCRYSDGVIPLICLNVRETFLMSEKPSSTAASDTLCPSQSSWAIFSMRSLIT